MLQKELLEVWAAVFALGIVVLAGIDLYVGRVYLVPRISLAEAVGLLIVTAGWFAAWYWQYRVIPNSRLQRRDEN